MCARGFAKAPKSSSAVTVTPGTLLGACCEANTRWKAAVTLASIALRWFPLLSDGFHCSPIKLVWQHILTLILAFISFFGLDIRVVQTREFTQRHQFILPILPIACLTCL